MLTYKGISSESGAFASSSRYTHGNKLAYFFNNSLQCHVTIVSVSLVQMLEN